MNIAQNRTQDFPRNVEANLGCKKARKRTAYKLAYFLLTFAYTRVYCPAYLPSTAMAERSLTTPIRLVLWVENSACHSPACSFSQN